MANPAGKPDSDSEANKATTKVNLADAKKAVAQTKAAKADDKAADKATDKADAKAGAEKATGKDEKPDAKDEKTAAKEEKPANKVTVPPEELAELQLTVELVQQTKEIVSRRKRAEALLAKAEAGKDKVKDEIFEKVQADYKRQLAEIAEEYEPVNEAVGDELRRIRLAENDIKTELGQVNDQIEELRFRCQVGEFDDAELKKREKEKLETVQKLEIKVKTIERTYEIAVKLLGDDAQAVLDEPFELLSLGMGLDDSTEEGTMTMPATDADVPVDGTVMMSSPEVPVEGTVMMSAGDLPPADGTVMMSSPAADVPVDGTVMMPSPGDQAAPDGTVMMPSGDIPEGTVLMPPGGGDMAAADGTMVMPRPATLLLKPTDGHEEQVYAVGEEALSIGRSTTNDVVLKRSTVSRRHALISRSGTSFVLTDISSGGGVLVNGTATKKAELEDGDELQIDEFEFVFQKS